MSEATATTDTATPETVAVPEYVPAVPAIAEVLTARATALVVDAKRAQTAIKNDPHLAAVEIFENDDAYAKDRAKVADLEAQIEAIKSAADAKILPTLPAGMSKDDATTLLTETRKAIRGLLDSAANVGEAGWSAYALATIPGLSENVKTRASGPADPNSAGKPRVRIWTDGKNDGEGETLKVAADSAKVSALDLRNAWVSAAGMSYDDIPVGTVTDFEFGGHKFRAVRGGKATA